MTKSFASQRPAPREAIGFARKGFAGAKAVGSFLPALTAKAFHRYGFSAASLITDWPAIAGRELAQFTSPERLRWPRTPERDHDEIEGSRSRRTGATLVLRVDGAKALNVQYDTRRIIERINAYFGYSAIAELRLVQAPVAAPQARGATRRPAEPLTREVADIADAGLRNALAKLGGEIRAGR